jgi:hypothetical protein
MRCVCEVVGGTEARKLLCRELEVKLGGATLLGRYGGGGSVTLLLSAKGSAGLKGFDDTEAMSDVSMPVRYIPFEPDPIGPRMIGWIWLDVDVGGS